MSSDASDVLAYRGRSDVCRYLAIEPMSAAGVSTFIAERRNPTRPGRQGGKFVVAMDLEGRVIGDVTMKFGTARNGQGEIGWVIHPECSRLGYATEAARALAHLAFTEWSIHRVWAQLDPRNTASVRMCERLGMRKEAHLREESWFKGEWGDVVIYAVLASEWSHLGAGSAG